VSFVVNRHLKILFHYPGLWHEVLDTGEKLRPVRMLAAFREFGHEVTVVAGSYRERQTAIAKLRGELKDYSFLYSETSSLPLRLANVWRLPHPVSADFALFRLARAAGMPIGVFIRDLYWQYPSFAREVGVLKQWGARPFYHEELGLYQQVADRVFVPSAEFAEQLPEALRGRAMPLPPGCDPVMAEPSARAADAPLRLLYVGSVAPPIYDLREMVGLISRAPDELRLQLTIVTREADWQRHAGSYRAGDRVTIAHATGAQLTNHYADADLFLMCFADNDYRRICMPLKLFEAIGHGLPVLSSGGNAVSAFVAANHCGWVADDIPAAMKLIAHLAGRPDEIAQIASRVRELRCEHTWRKRAEQVCAQLTEAPG